MIAKEGIPVIVVTGLVLLICTVVSFWSGSVSLQILSGIFLFLFIFHFFFFRDPERQAPVDDKLIISPADGTVIKIDEVDEREYFKTIVRRVSIFMSVFNVHVNRIPFSGQVNYVKYEPGKFLAAFVDDASDHNERSIIGISSARGNLLFKQIAGLIARRIIYNVTEGQQVAGGERFGMILYGSRVDLYFPLEVKVRIKLKQKVRSGITVIGEF